MSRILIFEKLNNVSDLKKETSDDGYIRLSGVFGVCGIRNNNKRVYSKDNYTKMIHEMQSRIKTEGVPGQLEHPSSMNIDVNNVSHMIESIDIDDKGVVTGTIKLLHTPKGKIAEEIVKGGLPLFVSSRACGSIDESGNVTLEELKTYDIVGTPGFSQARMNLKENQICESIDDDMYMIIENENNKDSMDEFQKQIEILRENNDTLKKTNNDLEKRISYLENKLDTIEDSNRDNIKSINEKLDNTQDNIDHIMESTLKKTNQTSSKDNSRELLECIQSWITEEYSKEVQNWITEEYSESLAEGIQNWVIEQLAPRIDEWCTTELKNSIIEETKESQSNMLKESKETKLDNIDKILEMLDTTPKKPVISRKVDTNEPYFIQNIPENIRPKWEMANESVKTSIKNRARLYNLSNEENIKKFWENVEFETPKTKTITEGLDNTDPYEKNLRIAIRRRHNNL